MPQFVRPFVAPDVLGGVIQGVCAILAAVIAALLQQRRHPVGQPLSLSRKTSIFWTLLAAFFVAALAGFVYSRLTLPSVTIDSPWWGQDVDLKMEAENYGTFMVKGTSTRVANRNELRIVLLARIAEPYIAGWWMQVPPVVDPTTGDWETICGTGSESLPPEAGQEYEILAIVVRASDVPGSRAKPIFSQKDLYPLAHSGLCRVRAASLR